jgi:hypothetical protein
MLDPCVGGHMIKSWLSHSSRLGSWAQFSWYLHKISCKICHLVRVGGGICTNYTVVLSVCVELRNGLKV